MISFRATDATGKITIILGLEPENIRRLTAGQPIHKSLESLGGADAGLVIFYADESALADLLKRSGGKPEFDMDEPQSGADMQGIAREFGLGATGEHPAGRLGPNDEGEIRLAVTVVGPIVQVRFGKPVAWVGLPPAEARALGALLIKHASEAEKAIAKG